MQFARWVFRIAGIYGILIIAPMYFAEQQIGTDYPPPITHPENFYGFIGVTLAFQFVFLLVARNPVRYRFMMLPSVFEKFTYAVAIVWLFAEQRIAAILLGFGLLDGILGILFLIAFLRTPDMKPIDSHSQ